MTAVDFKAFRHPVLAVACPSCRVEAGTWCRRPSGHKAMDLHRPRKDLADQIWQDQGEPDTRPTRRARLVRPPVRPASGKPGFDSKPACTAQGRMARFSHSDLVAAMAELGMSQAELRRRLEEASGEAMNESTVWRYTVPADQGGRKVPAGVAAYVKLLLSLRRLGVMI